MGNSNSANPRFVRTKQHGSDPIITVNDIAVDTGNEHLAGYVSWGTTSATEVTLEAFAVSADDSGQPIFNNGSDPANRIDGLRDGFFSMTHHVSTGPNDLFAFGIPLVPLQNHKVLTLMLVLTSRNYAGAVVSIDLEALTLYA